MWQMVLIFVVFLIFRLGIRAYQQNCLLNDIAKIEQESRVKMLRAQREHFGPPSSYIEEVTQEEEEEEVEGNDGVKLRKSQKFKKAEEEGDQVDDSKGHNVTNILTAEGSRKFHLNHQQIEQGKSLNKELIEILSKRKIHNE